MNKKSFTVCYLTVFLVLVSSCSMKEDIDYRTEMRSFVVGISSYAKEMSEGFIIIPQNGIELISLNGEPEGNLATAYLEAIDGAGQEDLFFGYLSDDIVTPADESEYLNSFLNKARDNSLKILVTDYCSSNTNMDISYSLNNAEGYISFAADNRELNNIPDYPAQIYSENANQISDLNQAGNFLYLINTENYGSRNDFINSVESTNYDLIIMDFFFNDGTSYSNAEIAAMRQKANGAQRLVVCYLSIGEAEDYRYYWNEDWNSNPPAWLDEENPDWDGNYKVKYWHSDWQDIIYGNNQSYVQRIIDAGFDGAYLDIIDAFEFFE